MGNLNGSIAWIDRDAVGRFVRRGGSAVGRYLIRVGDSLSQVLNVTLFFGQNPNESLSGRSHRLRDVYGWRELRVLIDTLFSLFQQDHCKKAFYSDIERAKRLLQENCGNG